MNVQEIVSKYLKEHGYDGLFCPGHIRCGCEQAYFMPCDEPDQGCQPGYRMDCPTGFCKFHIVPVKGENVPCTE